MLKLSFALLILFVVIIVSILGLRIYGVIPDATAETAKKIVVRVFVVLLCIALIIWAVKLAVSIPDQFVDMLRTAGDLD